jgi:Zn-dependent protease
MGELTLLQTIAVAVLPLLFGITVHEVAHGWVAKHLGDPTAQRLGRLTLNPIKHIDPVGTVLVPGVLLLMSSAAGMPFAIGWAKPVPVTWENLRHPRRDMILVAAAGPLSNLLMAVMWAGIAVLGLVIGATGAGEWAAAPLYYMGRYGIFINLILMVLNLLPIPPLDGGRVVAGLLPNRLSWQFSRIEPYGFFILIGLMILRPTGGMSLLGSIIYPPVFFFERLIMSAMGLAG